ncbi:L,D-transpeptidase family protein [Catenuloplanes atrovinosus]|uniref:L,D-TPase catalytic domain-containing protein n=1 Tax=Catenuloplanes atrovinosus TaxID=137266 RepID=A0AAE3YQX1_9ACTN|nr:L,D-transpeptidase family protein [Catenuloplanes atrovinosus]MDR7276141.1 hypothetical protein [Catenuloplanes atrovinosus]
MTVRGTVRRAVALGVAVVLAAGCGTATDAPLAQQATGTPTAPDGTPSGTGPPAPTATAPTRATPAPTPTGWPTGLPTVPTASAPAPTMSGIPTPGSTGTPTPTGIPTAGADGTLTRGESGPEILVLQQRLDALGYWNGPADGKFGPLTLQAVYAAQKAAGLERTGRADPALMSALAGGVRPGARSSKGHRVEIDLARQLLMLVDDGTVTRIFNTSTGSNEYYRYQGRRYLADTPAGRFRVGREIDAWRYGPLGPLYRPKYFNGGIAVHGAPSVPPEPASHGCARLTIAAMDWVWANGQMPVGTPVWVY